MKILLSAIFCLCLLGNVYAHGRSEEMTELLNAPVPEWLSLAEPIKVVPILDESLPAALLFRPRSGGATNSRNRVQIPERGIEFQVDYSIDWTGNNAEGLGVSLNPDGTKLLVNSGTNPHLYEITASGEHREVPIRLPDVTYDDGNKGFITKWSWAGNDALIGRSGITDERGHELLEVRFYLFHLKEQVLTRLDLSELKLPEDRAGMEIASISNDLEHLRIRLGESVFSVKVDLKSPPKPLPKTNTPHESKTQNDDQVTSPDGKSNTQSSVNENTPKEEQLTKRETIFTRPWALLIILIVAVIGLSWFYIRNRR